MNRGGLLTSDTQEPSPGLNVLMLPVKLAQVKSSMMTDELLGRPAPVPVPWSK